MLKELPIAYENQKNIRVIIDTDCYCECDDQYAITHALLTPKFDIKGIIAEQFGNMMGVDSEQLSYAEIKHIVSLVGLTDEVKVLHGAPSALTDEKTPYASEGARFIVEEAMKDDPRPLFVCNQGAVTNLASAYLLEPRIAEKITAIMISGCAYPKGGNEFNLCNDINAANVVYGSDIKIWQIPSNVYTTMCVSFMELLDKVYPCGDIGKYLVDNTMRVVNTMRTMVENIMKENPEAAQHMMADGDAAEVATSFGSEYWSLGDSPCIGLMINNKLGTYTMRSAPYRINSDGTYDLSQEGNRKIRVYDSIDSKFILNDMYAKLKFYFG